MYDANVLGAALGELGLELAWWPRNMDLKELDLAGTRAVLVNKRLRRRRLCRCMAGNERHWLALRPFETHSSRTWMNLDSKATTPAVVDDMRHFLHDILHAGGDVLLVVAVDAADAAPPERETAAAVLPPLLDAP